MKLKKYTDPEFLNIDEVFSEKVFLGANNIAIPYINIGLMPQNPITSKQSVIDYSYCVFIGVSSMFFNATEGNLDVEFNMAPKGTLTKYVGFGEYKSDNGAEVKIEYKALIFFIPDTAKINDPSSYFVPIDTPNFKQNMNTKEVDDFFSLQNLPKEIKDMLGDTIYSLTLF